jgi:hypothetical protein
MLQDQNKVQIKLHMTHQMNIITMPPKLLIELMLRKVNSYQMENHQAYFLSIQQKLVKAWIINSEKISHKNKSKIKEKTAEKKEHKIKRVIIGNRILRINKIANLTRKTKDKHKVMQEVQIKIQTSKQ